MRIKLVAQHLRPVSVVSVAAVGPYEVTTHEAWQHLQHLLVKHGVRSLARPVFALLRDMPHDVRPEDRRLELCAQLDETALRILQAEANIQTFAGGDYLMATHRGSYDRLPHIFGQMYAVCSLDMSISLDPKRPRVIVFRNDPATDVPDDLVAELGMPVITQAAERPNRAA